MSNRAAKKPLYRLGAVALALVPATAWAHPDHHGAGGLVSGMGHPLTGVDHMVAMVLVGVWAGLLAPNRKHALLIPGAFLAAMVAGFVGSPLLGGLSPEPLILLSLAVLGVAAAFDLRAPLVLAVLGAGLFGFAHGLAHGFETPGGALPAVFALGFLVSTAALHGVGMLLTKYLPAPVTRTASAAGAATALFMAGSA